MVKRETPDPSDFEEQLVDRLRTFVESWRNYEGTEQAGAQPFLQKLLEIYEVAFRPGTVFEQHPVRIPVADRKRAQTKMFGDDVAMKFTTERMDMYLPKICVWEMKSPSETDLEKHHGQLLGYWARVRTRYMVLSNFRELWIYDTNDENGQLAPKLRIPLEELPGRGDALLFLRGEEPDLVGRAERVTSNVARMLGRLMREVVEASPDPGRDRARIARLVLECVFAMFAEDTDLTPPSLFTEAMKRADRDGKLAPVLSLFEDFGRRSRVEKHNPLAPYVNGPLFDRTKPGIELTPAQIHDIYCAARDFDWQDVRPEIFGSIFEQALDPIERHELGAHFTREADIARVVGPTVIEPWRDRIFAIRTPQDAQRVVEQMRAFHVLDPACGCGNFLYVVYREMKRLEAALADKWTAVQRSRAKRRSDIRPPPARPYFTLEQLHGIEINEFAAFLARVVLWIGEHLAKRELGLDEATLPLKNLDRNIRHADALLVEWPRPEGELCVVGNPPYLGVRKLRQELGDEYVDALFERYPGNRAADYVTYWFARALETLRPGERAGYVCTNSVAQNESREASIDRLLEKGASITDAWESYPWPGEAAVHIAIVNWVMGPWDGIRTLDGRDVTAISPSLTDSIDVTKARAIPANKGLCFMGVTPGNAGFVLADAERDAILAADPRSAGVIKAYLIGRDVNREIDQRPTRWIIDFGVMEKEEAERFAGAMRHVRKHVYPVRKENRREAYARNWWRFVEPRPGLRQAIRNLSRVLTITAVGPHLLVTRHRATTCFDHKLYVVAVESFYHLGILQSAVHERWVRARPSTLKGDLSYANSTNFETFPFPLLPDGGYAPRVVPEGKQAARLEQAAEEFEGLRAETCKARSVGLTKIHNELAAGKMPELGAAYDRLNDAVCACYGWPAGAWRDDREMLRLLVELNEKLAAATGAERVLRSGASGTA